MPHRLWTHDCPDAPATPWIADGPECRYCGASARLAGIQLRMYEAMARYQYTFGVKPNGPHRDLLHQLLAGTRTDCTACDGVGLTTNAEPTPTWYLCPHCEGTGGVWTAPLEVVEVARAKVLRAFPGCGTDRRPDLRKVGGIVFDMADGTILGPARERGTPGGRMDEWSDGRMDGRSDGRMDGWSDDLRRLTQSFMRQFVRPIRPLIGQLKNILYYILP